VAAIASGGAPDLRASSIPLDQAAFSSIVRDGLLLTRGMPIFSELSDDDLSALRNYIRQQAERPTADIAQPHGP
jgi:quinohemoprotein ethanol dehydrogenase